VRNANHLALSAHLGLRPALSVMLAQEWDYYTDPHAWLSVLWEPRSLAQPVKAVVRDARLVTQRIQPSAPSVTRTFSF
jgi:hypothetical protein